MIPRIIPFKGDLGDFFLEDRGFLLDAGDEEFSADGEMSGSSDSAIASPSGLVISVAR